MANGKVLAVVPVYNEADKVRDTIEGLKKIDLIDTILIVNDGSTDNTAEVVDKLGVSIINLAKNQGKGFAMKKAMEQKEYDYIAFVDGDLGLSSVEVEKLIYPVVSGEVDFTIAKFPNSSDVTHIKGGFGFVKKLARYGVYKYTGTKINTSLSGQRVYNKKVIDNMCYIPDRFGVEVAMTVETLRMGYTVGEIDVNMSHRETGRSIRDFTHRGKQFLDIFVTLIKLKFKG